MSRCQHNEKICKFCVSSSCNHPYAGGCEYCFKRYHCHIGQTKFITESQITDIFRYLTSFEDKKFKIRPLKEAIYNYFNIIKGQLSTFLDCISSDLLNRISYPYVKKEGNLKLIKKLKHKQYSKITAQQVAQIVDFKEKNDPEKLQRNQIMSYIEESKEVFKKVEAINSLYKMFEKEAAQAYTGESIMSVSIFYKKIAEIYEHIESQKKAYIKKIQESLQSNKLSQQSNNQKIKKSKTFDNVSTIIQVGKKENRNQLVFNKQGKLDGQDQISDKQKVNETVLFQPILLQNKKSSVKSEQKQEKQQTRSRKVSIDSRCSDLIGKSRLKSFEQKQKEIQKRKQQLEQLMGKQKNKKQNCQSSSSSSNDVKENSMANSLVDSLSKSGVSAQRKQMGAHTLLPQGKQQKKLYEQQQKIQKKTLKIPVHVIQENAEDQECQSPILRLKKSQRSKSGSGKSGFQLGLFKVPQSKPEQQTHSEQYQPQLQSSQSNNSSESNDKENFRPLQPEKDINITEKEANSMILLVESLKMSAKKAISFLEASLKYAPHNFSAAQYLSYLYLDQNKPRQCLKVCNQALKLIQGQPNSVQLSMHLHNNKAAALNILGRFSESIPILQKCLAVKKKDILYKNIADAYFNLGIIQKAVVNYENCLILNDLNHEALYNLGVCLYIQKNYQGSKLKVQKALLLESKNESYLQLYKQIGNVLRQK